MHFHFLAAQPSAVHSCRKNGLLHEESCKGGCGQNTLLSAMQKVLYPNLLPLMGNPQGMQLAGLRLVVQAVVLWMVPCGNE